MKKTAIFIDAGYFYTEGSKLLTGMPVGRDRLSVETSNLLGWLIPPLNHESELLRIYWYDGIPRNGQLSPEQEKIAEAQNFKFRFSYRTAGDKQKGVDALIISDMMELARNKAITDAFLLSGDEDLLLGIQVSQSLGIRVHLIGIDPILKNQSQYLRREADSFNFLNKEAMEKILVIKAEQKNSELKLDKLKQSPISEQDKKTIFKIILSVLIGKNNYSEEIENIPSSIDGELLFKLEEHYNKKPEQIIIDFARKLMRHELRRLFLKS